MMMIEKDKHNILIQQKKQRTFYLLTVRFLFNFSILVKEKSLPFVCLLFFSFALSLLLSEKVLLE